MLVLTKVECERVMKKQLSALISMAGDANHLGKMLSVSNAIVNGWIGRGRISKQGGIRVEEHPRLGQKFKLNDLRPDLNE